MKRKTILWAICFVTLVMALLLASMAVFACKTEAEAPHKSCRKPPQPIIINNTIVKIVYVNNTKVVYVTVVKYINNTKVIYVNNTKYIIKYVAGKTIYVTKIVYVYPDESPLIGVLFALIGLGLISYGAYGLATLPEDSKTIRCIETRVSEEPDSETRYYF